MTMKIDHLAIWADNIELLRAFYMKYFGMMSNELYINEKKQFRSYFLSFGDSGARIELMTAPAKSKPSSRGQMKGLAHFCLSVGTKEQVMAMAEQFRHDGYAILSEPRTTGDGCFEAAIADPEGNYVEIAASEE